MKFGVLELSRSIPDDPPRSWKQRLWAAMRNGLLANGHQVEFGNIEAMNPSRLEMPFSGCQFMMFWNGQKKFRRTVREFVEQHGVQSICVEHGWFQRHEYFHFSLGGSFGPFAHFCDELATAEVTPAMQRRAEGIIEKPWQEIGVRKTLFAQSEPCTYAKPNFASWTKSDLESYLIEHAAQDYNRYLTKPKLVELAEAAFDQKQLSCLQFTPSDDGTVLIVLQVEGDAQHGDYQYDAKDYAELMLAQLAQIHNTRKIVIRSHPLGKTPKLEEMLVPESQRQLIAIHNGADFALQADLAEAKYLVSFNSNSVNEALVQGVPCVVNGPHLARMDKVVLPADIHDTYIAMSQAEAGWQPEPEAIRNYLARLCDRQWNCAEIESGKVLVKLLREVESATQKGE